MKYRRMPIEIESPEQMGYGNIDCNLTESSFSDALLGDLGIDFAKLLLCYGDHLGKPELRAQIAGDAPPLSPDNILVTTGAASALFIISTSLLKPGDHLIVMRPNYATNLETPRAIGAAIDFFDLTFEEGFQLNVDRLAARITKDTKLVSLTSPHNPTGAMMSAADLRRVLDLVESHGARLMLDETYRDMAFGEPLPCAAALSERAISVSSLSKTYGLPGIRIGWIACRDKELMETFLAAKEQIVICNSVVDEEIAYRFLKQKQQRLPEIRRKIAEHFGIVKEWMQAQAHLEWIEPLGGVVCFPRIKESSGVQVDRFYKILNGETRTFVGPGHWFEQDRRYMRIGFGWPSTDELRRGLIHITTSLEHAID